MNSSEVKCFLAAAKYLSFSRAADALFLSRQAVSRQVIHLEEELQVKLFLRNNQTLTLTEHGTLYYEFFESVCQRWKSLQNSVHSESPANSIAVAYLEGLNITQALLDNIFSLGEQFHVSIDLQTYDMHDLPKVVADGNQDFILTYQGPRLDMFSEFQYVPVETVDMVLVVSNALKDRGSDITRYEEFPVVTWQRKGQATEEAIQHCVEHCMDFGFSCHNVHVASNRDTARMEIEIGRCIGVCTAIDRMAHSPSVFTLPLTGNSTIACMWRKNNRSPVVKEIVRTLRKRAGQREL